MSEGKNERMKQNKELKKKEKIKKEKKRILPNLLMIIRTLGLSLIHYDSLTIRISKRKTGSVEERKKQGFVKK